jgi:hypothetical protein
MLAISKTALLLASCVLTSCRSADAAAPAARTDAALSDAREQENHGLGSADPSRYDWLRKRKTVSPALIQAALSCESVCSRGIEAALVVDSGPWVRAGGWFTQRHKRIMIPDPKLLPRSTETRTVRSVTDPDEILAILRAGRQVTLQIASVEWISRTNAKVALTPIVLHTAKYGIGIGCSDSRMIRRRGAAWCCEDVPAGCWIDVPAVQQGDGLPVGSPSKKNRD